MSPQIMIIIGFFLKNVLVNFIGKWYLQKVHYRGHKNEEYRIQNIFQKSISNQGMAIENRFPKVKDPKNIIHKNRYTNFNFIKLT